MTRLLVTTSIAYVNGAPHLGFAMESIQADAYARWARSRGHTVTFLTGTDEHGSKIFRTAAEKNMSPQQLTNENARAFQRLTKVLHLSNDDFVRTSEPRHKRAAQNIWKKIAQKGDLEKQHFEGRYCVGCEVFLTEKDLDENGLCPHHRKKPETITEENWFFLLSRYSQKIETLLNTNALRILPEFRKNEILELAKNGLHDVSFSRPKENLPWGVDVPDDETQVMYVWCDALSNYLTGVGFGKNERWREVWEKGKVVHFIGKDILRFHAALWPAMLSSAEMPLPSTICVHGFLTSEGYKMSKSLGNVVDPFAVVDDFGGNPDALRFFLLAEVPFGRDADFSQKRFLELYNAKLANGLGNVFARVMTLAEKGGAKKSTVISNPLLREHIEHLAQNIDQKMSSCELHLALETLWKIVDTLNIDIDEKKPWLAMKEDIKAENKNIGDWLSVLEIFSNELASFLPHTAEQMRSALENGEKVILFPRKEAPKQKEVSSPKKHFSFLVSRAASNCGIIADFLLLENIGIKKSSRAAQKFFKKQLQIWEKNESWKEIARAQDAIKTNLGFKAENFLSSPQFLLSLFEKNGKLPGINNLVDLYNFLSLKTGLSLGAHDLTAFQEMSGKIDLTTGTEHFQPLNTEKKVAVQKGEYGFFIGAKEIGCRFDALQSEKSKITESTKNALIYFQAPKGYEKTIASAKKEFLGLWRKFG